MIVLRNTLPPARKVNSFCLSNASRAGASNFTVRLPANVLVDSGSFAARVLALTILISPVIQSISPHSKAISSLGRRPVQKENCNCGHVSPLAAANIANCSSRVNGSTSSSSFSCSRFLYAHPESGLLSKISSSTASLSAERKQL
ncbi:hypothetical protein D3C84_485620 [compost metagenome]